MKQKILLEQNKENNPRKNASLRQTAARGVIWTLSGFAGTQVVRLIGNLILTRLLFPEAFGLMALVNIVITGMALFSDVGLTPSVVRSQRGDDPKFLDTVWTIQIIRGWLLWIIVLLLAYPVAYFYDEPSLATILPIASLILPISGFTSTSMMSFSRHLALGKLTLIGLGTQFLAILTMIAWAWVSPSVWAFVAGNLVGALAALILSFKFSTRRNRLKFNYSVFKELYDFGKWIFISTILSFLATQFDRLVFAKLIPLSALGVYSIGYMLAQFPEQLSGKLAGSVVFPAFSRKMNSGGDVGPIYSQVRLPSLCLTGLTAIPLCASAIPLINILYDERYADAGWILQILAAGAWLRALEIVPGSALLARGLPIWITMGHGAKLMGLVLFVSTGFWLWGFKGGVVGVALSNILLYGVVSIGANQQGVATVRSDMIVTMLAAVSVVVGILAADQVASDQGGDLIRFFAAASISSICWVILMEGLSRLNGQSLIESITLLRNSRSNST